MLRLALLPRRVVVLACAAAGLSVLVLAAVVSAVLMPDAVTVQLHPGGLTSATPAPSTTASPDTTPSPQPSMSNEDSGPGGPPIVVGPTPDRGSERFAYQTESGPTFGAGGSLITYRVAVETSVPVTVGEFTTAVDRALGDPRGWTGDGQRRFQRVGGASSITVMLTSPWTAYEICRPYVDIRIGGVPYSSCQAGSQIVVNSARYLSGSNAFTGTLDVYRMYVINHEVGHRLGRRHVGCPGPGQLAPVMQQQTLRMDGCLPNGWPYPHIPVPPPSPSPSPSHEPSPEPSPEPSVEPEPTDTPTGIA